MISFTSVRVTGFSRRYFDVDWSIAPTHDDLQEWQFWLERSEAEAGPWLLIAGPLIDRYYVRDNTTPQISLNRTLFYRVRATNPSRHLEIISDISDREGQEDLIAAEIGSLEYMLLTEFTGTRAWLFPRRTFGQRCPQCWDDVMNKRLDDSCGHCYGTGFSGGYHYPIEFFGQFDQTQKNEQVSTYDHHQQATTSFRCLASPNVVPGDLVINHRNRRLRVLAVTPTSRLGVTVHQEVQAVTLQPGSIEDAIELKVDHRTLALAAGRNYTSPMNPEAAGILPDDALSDLLGRYGYSR